MAEDRTENSINSGLSRRQTLAGAAGLIAAGAGLGLARAGSAQAATSHESSGFLVDSIQTSGAPSVGLKPAVQNFVTRPTLKPPVMKVTNYASDPWNGLPPYIALTPKTILPETGVQSGPMVMDTQGNLVWYWPTKGVAFDCQVQSYNGSEALTYWSGNPGGGVGRGTVYIQNEHYGTIRNIAAEQDVQIDLHEHNITPSGTILLTAYSQFRQDATKFGGAKNQLIWNCHVYEVNIKTGKLVWDWNAAHHVGLDESYQPCPPKAANTPWDFFHMNAVSVDPTDGNIIVSSRDCWTVYKINKKTYDVMWRMGGKKSDFSFGSGSTFAWQHHARRLSATQMTLFNNDATITVQSGRRSAGLLLNINETAKTVSLGTAFEHPAGFIANTQGSVQLLPSGGAFVCWGAQPYMSLHDATGAVTSVIEFPQNMNTYRAFLVDWPFKSGAVPTVKVQTGANGGTVVWASFNGVAGVAAWRIYAGNSSSALSNIGWQPATGFETAVVVNSDASYFQAVALDANNDVLGKSPVTKA